MLLNHWFHRGFVIGFASESTELTLDLFAQSHTEVPGVETGGADRGDRSPAGSGPHCPGLEENRQPGRLGEGKRDRSCARGW